jgi:ribA/ribD-fused uncharacterized protein
MAEALAQANSPIHFHSSIEEYKEFSNFYKREIYIDSKSWLFTEAFFQAMKFPDDPAHQAHIRSLTKPKEAKFAGGNRSKKMRDDWDNVREQVLLCALRAKFTQHEDLRKLLLSTGNRELIEHTSSDKYWGDGGDGSGQNRMGKLLMQIRAELRVIYGNK